MKITIRPAKVEDARDIARIRVTTWRFAYQGIMPHEILASMDIEKESERWKEILAQFTAERGAFVAEVEAPGEEGGTGGQFVPGYCFCGPVRNQDREYTGELYALYVQPDRHRRGLGKLLVQAAARFLIGQGYRRMIIYVLRENQPSRAFYEAIGGKAVREKQDEIGGTALIEVGYGYDLDDFKEIDNVNRLTNEMGGL
jgi:ribosomal protein S18 acetylase RimI-like enzyme